MRALACVLPLLVACGSTPIGLTCPRRVEILGARMSPLVAAATDIDPWARPTAPPGPVPPDRLAALDLGFHSSDTGRAVSLDGAGRRHVGSVVLTPGRAALCAGLATLPTPSDPNEAVRVHIDAVTDASLAFEFLADLHSCEAYRVDLVFRREGAPPVERSIAVPPPAARLMLPGGATTPPELRLVAASLAAGECPVDFAEAAEAPPREQPARSSEAVLAAHGACGCKLEDEQIVAAWQAGYLPSDLLTTLPIRTSPSALAFAVRGQETWQEAARRLLGYLGPDRLVTPSLLWFENQGSLRSLDEAPLPPPPPGE